MKREADKMHAKRNYLYTSLYFVLVLVLWLAISYIPKPQTVKVAQMNGFCALTQMDFSDKVYSLDDYWETWPEELYTPDDFTNGTVTTEAQFIEPSAYKYIPYATHKLRLNLPPGVTYGISMLTSDYAMRIYIDGIEIDNVGSPGKTRETTVNRSLERTYYFTTESGNVELIVQAANFVHAKDGTWPPSFIIGTVKNMTHRDSVIHARTFLVIGCLLTSFLYHLGLFCLNRRRTSVLLFSLCCLLLAVLDKHVLMLVAQEFDWQVSIRIEYFIHYSTFVMLFAFMNSIHPRMFNQIILRSYYALAAVYFLITLLTDSLIFTALLIYFEIASILFIVYGLTKLTLALRNGKEKEVFSFLGAVVLGLLSTSDILYYRGITIFPMVDGHFFMSPIGMVFFVFCYAMVLSIEYLETAHAMREAQAKEQQLATENASLERMNNFKTELMSKISHEARTPLAVLASYSGLVSMELRDQGVDAQTAADLDKIAYEAKRVAGLIDGMKRLAMHTDAVANQTNVNIGELMVQTARLYRPMLERSGVKLIIDIDEDLPSVLGNLEELTQVLFNLLQNSKNHTSSGSITLTAKKQGDTIVATVADTGSGISEDLLPHVFEWRVHNKKNGSGLGLAICKEVVEAHRGTIEIQSTLNHGTQVLFTLPINLQGGTE